MIRTYQVYVEEEEEKEEDAVKVPCTHGLSFLKLSLEDRDQRSTAHLVLSGQDAT